jgi:hypothetical protein
MYSQDNVQLKKEKTKNRHKSVFSFLGTEQYVPLYIIFLHIGASQFSK